MTLKESGEMYLEAIYVLSKEQPMVRSIDVAEYLEVSKPAVSRFMAKLKADEYLTIAENGHILLTKKGAAVASKIYERHTILTQILIQLGVDEETASEDACKMEHDISDKSFAAIKAHLKNNKK